MKVLAKYSYYFIANTVYVPLFFKPKLTRTLGEPYWLLPTIVRDLLTVFELPIVGLLPIGRDPLLQLHIMLFFNFC